MSDAPKPLWSLGGPPGKRSAAQQWVLATQGVLTEQYNANHARMGGLPRPLCANFGALFLRRDWGIRSRREALAQIDWLIDVGHRTSLAAAEGRPANMLLAWDLVRASAVAGWAYVAYQLDADQAWSSMVRAARALSAGFSSWAAVGESYAAGFALWRPEARGSLAPLLVGLNATEGAWSIPWSIDLSAEIPPPIDPLPELVVDAAGGNDVYPTIGSAIAAAAEAQASAKIIVRSGVYRESVRINYPVEIVADGEVRIECSDGAPIVSRKQNATIEGFTLISGTNGDGEAMQAVWLAGYSVKLVDCTIRSSRCGVYAHGPNAFVTLEHCRIDAAVNSGVLADDGAHAVILDSEIRDTQGVGIFATGGGELRIESTLVENTGGSGLSVGDTVLAELTDLAVRNAAVNGIEVLGHARSDLRGLRIEAAGQTGLLVNSAERTLLLGTSITRSGGNDLGLMTGSTVAVDSMFGGGPGCGVCVGGGAEALFKDCSVEGTTMPSVVVMDGGVSRMVRCTAREGQDRAVWVMDGGHLKAVGCVFDGRTEGAIEFGENEREVM